MAPERAVSVFVDKKSRAWACRSGTVRSLSTCAIGGSTRIKPGGRNLFKQRVMAIENRCRITGVANPFGFEGDGTLIISPVAHLPSLERIGVETETAVNVGSFT